MKEVAIKTAYDFITRIENDACIILENDIDFEGRVISQVGSESEPFCGVFEGRGHKLSNFRVDSLGRETAGLFGVNKGLIQSLVIENMQLSGAMDGCAAGIIGINYGKVYDIKATGQISVRARFGENFLSAITGKNYGELVNINSALNLDAVTTGGKLFAGSFTGLGDGGRYETLETTGEINLTGENIKAGLAAGSLKNTLVLACMASTPMNLLNEKVYTDLTAEAEDVKYDAFLWRDNRNDDRLLSREESEMRDKVVRTSLAMSTFPWKPDRDMEFKNTNRAEVHHQVFKKGVQQYAPPYDHEFNSPESMQEAFNADGTPKPWLAGDGPDGMDLYIGNDCSGNTYWSWATVANDFDFMVTVEMRPGDNHGCVAIPPCDGSLGEDTETLMRANGNDVMAESMARAHKGDAINANYPPTKLHGRIGHTRVVTHSSVVYRDQAGKIEFGRSYMITTEQGDGLYHKGTGKYPSMSWLTDYHYTFLTLMRTYYMPISTKVLLSGKIPKEEVSFESSATGDDMVYTGKAKANFRITATTGTVTDKGGNVVWQKKLFTAVHAFSEIMDSAPSRETIKEVDLADYKPLWNPKRLPAGEYRFTFDVLLSTHSVHRVCDKTFRLGKGGKR